MNDQMNSIKAILEAPFSPEQIKTREGSRGAVLSYVDGATVIQRLNDAFCTDWNFTILEWNVIENDVLVLGRLSACSIEKDAFGCSHITLGRDTNKPLDIGSDVKSAATDALKKAASLFGVALQLYSKSEEKPKTVTKAEVKTEKPEPKSEGNNDGGSGNGNGRITSKQLGYVFSLAKERSMDNAAVKTMAFQRFNKSIEFLSKQEASEFIGWFMAQQKVA